MALPCPHELVFAWDAGPSSQGVVGWLGWEMQYEVFMIISPPSLLGGAGGSEPFRRS